MTRLRPKLTCLPPRVAAANLQTARVPPKRAEPFYTSPAWRALMATLIRTRGRQCQAQGCGRSDTRIYGDHIVELQDGGAPLDPGNVQLLCGACHTAKTTRTRAARQAAHHGRPPT